MYILKLNRDASIHISRNGVLLKDAGSSKCAVFDLRVMCFLKIGNLLPDPLKPCKVPVNSEILDCH